MDTEADCEVMGNAALLRQLILNLLDNALTHNIAEAGSVRLSVVQDGTTVVLEADNTGPHVDEAVVDRLFEPFYRVRSRVGSDRSGHGLGLAIVRSIAASHRGTATATANPTGGLTLRVGLPASPAHEEGPGGPQAPGGGLWFPAAACAGPRRRARGSRGGPWLPRRPVVPRGGLWFPAAGRARRGRGPAAPRASSRSWPVAPGVRPRRPSTSARPRPRTGGTMPDGRAGTYRGSRSRPIPTAVPA